MATATQAFVSLFTGAGGLDLGLEAAGWRPLAQIECDTDAVGTLRLAAERRAAADGEAQPTLIIPKRIEEQSPRELRKQLGLKKGELPLIAGGPPCQPFTTHGLRQALTDRRAVEVWPTYLQYVDEFSPKALLIENVDGLLSAALQHRPLKLRNADAGELSFDERKGSFLHWLLNELADRGYTTTWGLAEAADYGVPQMRQRSIIIGVKGKTPCYLPAPQYGQPGLPPVKTLKEALSDIEELGPVQPLSSRKTAVYEKIPAGGNWRDLPKEMQISTMGKAYEATGGKSGWWRRLSWDSPTPTILGMPDHSSTALIHPDETRCLSVNECAAAQSFPPGTRFAGKPRSQYQQIGNAVPPLLGAALGRHISAFLVTRKDSKPSPPDWRKTSANRRIGTHGWVIPDKENGHKFTLNVKIRPDHVWFTLNNEDIDSDTLFAII
ncbi:DNA cytosine methyltransferase [Streptomyces sp. WAC08401]|uniref:DNA cytosine methyltransferase n=1 Tax=Streptomyces sp. WAC08401 TaxID=2487413 RepID=UPI00163B6533|nr:DNA cytosine methyltransferase [Streptomyces sp. WAC08401]